MVKLNGTHPVKLRAAMAAAILGISGSASAVTIGVDGNLADLIAAVGSTSLNTQSGSDPMGSADSPVTESNNGFDINNVYAFYDKPTDILYVGFNVYGTVGDSQAVTNTTSLYERTTALPNANRSVFDSNETYRLRLFNGTTDTDPLLLAYTVTGQDAGGDVGTYVSNGFSLLVSHAVSEANNGVEFSIFGLATNNALLLPDDLTIFIGAGSTDFNSVSGAAEDTHLMSMQVVPVPAAVWLFGSGLAGLLGLSFRKSRA